MQKFADDFFHFVALNRADLAGVSYFVFVVGEALIYRIRRA